MTQKAKNLKGRLGEEIAAEYLKKKKYQLLSQNIRLPFGEIDLLVQDGQSIVLVEVKTKDLWSFGRPEEQVGPAKRKKLKQLARWVTQQYPQQNLRIDIIAVDLNFNPPKVTHFINAIQGD
jgi:putative endonuclease